MTGSFGVAKFKGLLLAGSFTVLAGYVVRLTDSIVAGHMLGAEALAAIGLVAPILSAISFLGGLIATGMATHYSLAMGRLDATRARQFFTQAVWSVLIFGGALALAILFGKDAFLSFQGAAGEVASLAATYLRWVWPVAILECFVSVFESMGYADGDSRLCSAAYAVIFVVNVVVSVAGLRLGLGIGACAFGSVVANAAGLAVMSLHFLRKGNTFRFVRHFSLADSWRIASASFGDAAAFLCDALLFLFVNTFAVAMFGMSVLPVVGVISALWGLLEFFNGVGVAVQPIVTVYYGEGNTKAVRTVMGSAMRVAFVEGLVFSLFFGCWPEAAVRMVGLTNPDLVREACLAVRLMCGGFVALSFAGLFNSYYMFVERPLLAGLVTFGAYLILPVACVATGSLFGIAGLWAGVGAGPFAGCALAALFIVATEGWRMFPLLLPRDREAKIRVFGLSLDEFGIVKTSRMVAAELEGAGVDEAVVMRASLMVEEVLMVVKDRNAGRKVRGEVTLDLNDGIVLTLRDDGEIFDITDADARISSLRTFLVASVMERQTGRINLVTTGFNRNVFRF